MHLGLRSSSRSLPPAPQPRAPHPNFWTSSIVMRTNAPPVNIPPNNKLIFDTMVAPEVTLTHLNRADGSATYTHNGYSIIGAVNGPIEVLRKDEMPEEATIEVNVRPAAGVGSTYISLSAQH